MRMSCDPSRNVQDPSDYAVSPATENRIGCSPRITMPLESELQETEYVERIILKKPSKKKPFAQKPSGTKRVVQCVDLTKDVKNLLKPETVEQSTCKLGIADRLRLLKNPPENPHRPAVSTIGNLQIATTNDATQLRSFISELLDSGTDQEVGDHPGLIAARNMKDDLSTTRHISPTNTSPTSFLRNIEPYVAEALDKDNSDWNYFSLVDEKDGTLNPEHVTLAEDREESISFEHDLTELLNSLTPSGHSIADGKALNIDLADCDLEQMENFGVTDSFESVTNLNELHNCESELKDMEIDADNRENFKATIPQTRTFIRPDFAAKASVTEDKQTALKFVSLLVTASPEALSAENRLLNSKMVRNQKHKSCTSNRNLKKPQLHELSANKIFKPRKDKISAESHLCARKVQDSTMRLETKIPIMDIVTQQAPRAVARMQACESPNTVQTAQLRNQPSHGSFQNVQNLPKYDFNPKSVINVCFVTKKFYFETL